MSVFETLNAVNVNGHTETKKTGSTELTYLSWPWAWAEVKKKFPTASYSVWKDPNTGLPYTYDEETGYMVYTSATIDGVTHEMWLPVMDGANKAMKADSYTYLVKNPNFRYATYDKALGYYTDRYGKRQNEYIEKTCEAASMFDINKTIMRCLVKNFAMFGLGLYIYAGEDLPEGDAPAEDPPAPEKMANLVAPEPTAPPPPATLPPLPQPEPPMFKCEKCGKVLQTYTGADGKTVSLRKHAEGSKKKFGAVLCLDCINSLDNVTE